MPEPAPRGRNPCDTAGVERGDRVALRDEPLPRNPAGKVLKAQLRDETEWGEPLR